MKPASTRCWARRSECRHDYSVQVALAWQPTRARNRNNEKKETIETKVHKCAGRYASCTPTVTAYVHKCKAKDPRSGYFDSCKGRKKIEKKFSNGNMSDPKQCKAYCDKAHAEVIKAVSTKTCKSGLAVYTRMFCNSPHKLYKGKNTETGTTHYKITRCK